MISTFIGIAPVCYPLFGGVHYSGAGTLHISRVCVCV